MGCARRNLRPRPASAHCIDNDSRRGITRDQLQPERGRSARLSVAVDTLGTGAQLRMTTFLLGLTGLTVVLAVALDAAHTRYPVAIAIVIGSPTLMASIRRRAALGASTT